jgi:D-glycero-D-manno-heptose 1,7-bisphosphate phosphatase
MPALFLDRDGVILRVEAGKYNNTVFDCEFLPGTVSAIVKLGSVFYPIIIITNAGSAIHRGLSRREDIRAIHEWIQFSVEDNGGQIAGAYYCPHTMGAQCKCRKPGTELFEQACRDFLIDPKDSYVVGDSASDVLAAVTIGATPVLVRTGLGGQLLHEVIEDPGNYGMLMDANPLIVDDLLAFAYWIKVKPLTEYAKKATAPSHTTA